jgi:hypothetical protein
MNLKSRLIFLIALLFATSCQPDNQPKQQTDASLKGSVIDSTERTNNFYDNVETYPLASVTVRVEGEIEAPYEVDFSKLVKRSVIVKETLLKGDKDSFTGAYRYDGYSLFDILSPAVLKKSNQDEFPPIIDMYVEIENQDGEKIILSWGEIYYPNIPHQILVATDVARIVPSKTKDLWPLPDKSKIVVAYDLITERNISSPAVIRVKSYHRSFFVEKGMSPMYSATFSLYTQDTVAQFWERYPEGLKETAMHTIFYGRGRGIHSTQPFTGVMMNELLSPYIPVSQENLRLGTLLFTAPDGYRVCFSLSELINRNDQQQSLLVFRPEEEDGGAFRLFPSADFFSDRAVRSVNAGFFSITQN